MRLPFPITVKESITELKALQRRHGALAGKNIRMLIKIKKQENTRLSKQVLPYKKPSQPIIYTNCKFYLVHSCVVEDNSYNYIF